MGYGCYGLALLAKGVCLFGLLPNHCGSVQGCESSGTKLTKLAKVTQATMSKRMASAQMPFGLLVSMPGTMTKAVSLFEKSMLSV